jgi:hypothetical protein
MARDNTVAYDGRRLQLPAGKARAGAGCANTPTAPLPRSTARSGSHAHRAGDGGRRGPDHRECDTVLVTVKDAARRLRRCTKRAMLRAASLSKGRSRRRSGPQVEQRN